MRRYRRLEKTGKTVEKTGRPYREGGEDRREGITLYKGDSASVKHSGRGP